VGAFATPEDRAAKAAHGPLARYSDSSQFDLKTRRSRLARCFASLKILRKL